MVPRKVTIQAGATGGPTKDITVEVHDLDATPWGADAKLTHVGRDLPRFDGPVKATGAARYTYDIFRPNMAYCRLVRSPHAHAVVTSVDVSAARRVPGVLDVLELMRTGGRITFAGKGVVAVCAETEEALDDGLHAIEIAYEVLPTAVTTEDAARAGAPRVDPKRANKVTTKRGVQKRGDAAKALAGAHKKVSGIFRTAVQTHSALEPHGCVVEPNGDGTFTVWASTQGTGSVRGGIAKALGLKPNEVRVISEHVGGGFGAKFGIDEWDRAAALFARKLDRPVKSMISRRAEHLVAGNRPDSIQDLSLGCDEKGNLTALAGTVLGTPGNGAGGANAANSRVYRIPNLDMTQSSVSTFTGRQRAFRAPGHPQGVFALEGAVDMLAHEMGADPLAFRLQNDPHPLRQAQWRLGAERIGWDAKRKVAPGAGAGPVQRGVGCGASVWRSSGRGKWVVNLEITREGSVTVSNAVQDIGTGTRTILAILVAEELGIAPGRVTVRIGDTASPAGPPSGGSTTAPSIGPAAREAGLRAKERLLELLVGEWEVASDAIRIENGVFTASGGKRATFDEACALIGPEGITVSGQRRRNYAGFHNETAGCQFAEVAVDTETGIIKVERVVAVHDAGRIIDPLTARSQVVGGVIQGISYALYEERQMDRNLGDMVNPTLDTYRILGIRDCPRIDALLTTMSSGFNNAGMMGLGEPTTVPTAAAVANAVFHATGVRMLTLPMTPRTVLAALRGAR